MNGLVMKGLAEVKGGISCATGASKCTFLGTVPSIFFFLKQVSSVNSNIGNINT